MSDSRLLLALDTTTRAGSTCVARGDEILGLIEGEGERTHGERLPAEIAAALSRAGIAVADLSLLVVASGPGAFTGLRIGLAAIQGLAMTLSVPVIGVSALEALAHVSRRHREGTAVVDAEGCPVATMMDAQRGEVYAALYDGRASDLPRLIEPPIVGTPEQIIDAWRATHGDRLRAIGDGAIRHRDTVASRAPGWTVETPPPLAPALAWLGRRRAARGEAGPPHALQPLYVRRPDAELERERRADG